VEYAEKGSRKEARRFSHYKHWHIIYDENSLKRAATEKYLDD
jgi:hypothetical protein